MRLTRCSGGRFSVQLLLRALMIVSAGMVLDFDSQYADVRQRGMSDTVGSFRLAALGVPLIEAFKPDRRV